MKLLRRHWLIGILAVLAVAAVGAFRLKVKQQSAILHGQGGPRGHSTDGRGHRHHQCRNLRAGRLAGVRYHFSSICGLQFAGQRGQVIAQIDPALFEGSLLQAKADLANARANVATTKANLQKALATQIQMAADYERAKSLTAQGVMSPQQLDLAKANSDSAVAAVAAGDAQVKQAEAQVQQRKAAVTVAQTNLDYTTIRAPIDGTVIARNVDVGQTVAASLQAPTLFTIAQDLTKMQVYASTDESDVGAIRANQQVTFKVDAYPKENFSGLVSQVRMNATTVQNVVTYNTIIDFENPAMKLFPGMTAYVTIPVASAADVLRVPNSALRYKPDMKAEEIRALFKKFGLDDVSPPPINRAALSSPESGGGMVKQVNHHIAGKQTNAVGLASTSAPRLDVAVLWKLRSDKTLEPVRIRSGITDHTVTEVAELFNGSLKDNDDVVTGAVLTGPKMGPGTTAANRH